MKKSLIILICGGSGSGKSTFAKKFPDAAIISTDNFYIGRSHMTPLKKGVYDFDDPCAVDLIDCAHKALSLARGKTVHVPEYDMKTSERTGRTIKITPPRSRVVIVEGIFAFHGPVGEIGDLKIFIDVPTHERLSRRIKRSVVRGETKADALKRSALIEKAHKKHVEPIKTCAYSD